MTKDQDKSDFEVEELNDVEITEGYNKKQKDHSTVKYRGTVKHKKSQSKRAKKWKSIDKKFKSYRNKGRS